MIYISDSQASGGEADGPGPGGGSKAEEPGPPWARRIQSKYGARSIDGEQDGLGRDFMGSGPSYEMDFGAHKVNKRLGNAKKFLQHEGNGFRSWQLTFEK